MAPPLSIVENDHGRYYVYGLVTLLAFGVVRYIYNTLTSPLLKVPGPFLARFTRLWELHSIRKYDNATFNIALHEKYGPVVRLAPNRYMVNDAEAARLILGHGKGQPALDKTPYYYAFGTPHETNLFSEQNTATHSNMRRPYAQLYSQTNLLAYEPFVDTCNSILLKRLEEYHKTGKTLDVREMMQFYAFDVIGEISVGSRFGLMEDDGDKTGVVQIIDEGLNVAALVGLVPEMHWWMGKAAAAVNFKPSVLRLADFIEHHVDQRASGRTKSPEDRQDFIDKMLPLEEAGKAVRAHTRQAIFQNIGAGSDTTAISLTSVIAHLTQYPETLAALRKEIDEATAAGRLSNPATFQEAQKLPYLQACILEALRVHPAVGAPLARVVGPTGLHVAGQFFPPGTEVGVNPWVIHNNPSIFGPDAHLFRPERWLTADKEQRSLMDRNFLSFGTGPRTCIGKNISLLEMSKVIPQIVRKYEFDIVPDENGTKYSWVTRWFAKQNFNVVVRRRADKAQ